MNSQRARIPFDPDWQSRKCQVRDEVKAAFDFRCAYCQRRSGSLTLDHVFPQTRGGRHHRRNLVPACSRCNRDKGSQSLLTWYTSDLSFFSAERLDRILAWIKR